jgi:diguanylate cyclase (GGDEF)-like protein
MPNLSASVIITRYMTAMQKKASSGVQRWRPDLVFATAILILAIGAIAYAWPEPGLLTGVYGWRTALFFLLFGLFTITMGYARPGFGHVSFDRVAQVSSILVLGPFDAALIGGLASLIYPWHRIWMGVPTATVVTASMHNAGMMACMMYLRKTDPASMLNIFSISIELASAPLAILVAIVFVQLDLAVFGLMLFCLALGMMVLKQYAEMRNKLEALVDARTEELELKSLELERQATHDGLTGLFNRRYADEYLKREIENSKRYDRDFTIALADIDHFKQINDRYSHAIGDEVLRQVAEILVNRCRKTDVVARYSGEEFLLCFPDTNSEFAEQICGQIRIAIEKADWSSIASEIRDDVNITISFGIAKVGRDSRRTTILSDADTRLYQAKNKGRNRVIA